LRAGGEVRSIFARQVAPPIGREDRDAASRIAHAPPGCAPPPELIAPPVSAEPPSGFPRAAAAGLCPQLQWLQCCRAVSPAQGSCPLRRAGCTAGLCPPRDAAAGLCPPREAGVSRAAATGLCPRLRVRRAVSPAPSCVPGAGLSRGPGRCVADRPHTAGLRLLRARAHRAPQYWLSRPVASLAPPLPGRVPNCSAAGLCPRRRAVSPARGWSLAPPLPGCVPGAGLVALPGCVPGAGLVSPAQGWLHCRAMSPAPGCVPGAGLCPRRRAVSPAQGSCPRRRALPAKSRPNWPRRPGRCVKDRPRTAGLRTPPQELHGHPPPVSAEPPSGFPRAAAAGVCPGAGLRRAVSPAPGWSQCRRTVSPALGCVPGAGLCPRRGAGCTAGLCLPRTAVSFAPLLPGCVPSAGLVAVLPGCVPGVGLVSPAQGWLHCRAVSPRNAAVSPAQGCVPGAGLVALPGCVPGAGLCPRRRAGCIAGLCPPRRAVSPGPCPRRRALPGCVPSWRWLQVCAQLPWGRGSGLGVQNWPPQLGLFARFSWACQLGR
jgi:hypothetical protein